jgi:hypothetical protein
MESLDSIRKTQGDKPFKVLGMIDPFSPPTPSPRRRDYSCVFRMVREELRHFVGKQESVRHSIVERIEWVKVGLFDSHADCFCKSAYQTVVH